MRARNCLGLSLGFLLLAAGGQAQVSRQLAERWRGNDAEIKSVTPEKVEYLGQLHCNCLRLHLDVDPVHPAAPMAENPLAPYQANLKRLDDILPLCRKYGIQIILVGGDIYGRKTDVFEAGTIEGPDIRRLLNEFWIAISRRYRDEPVIVAYDIKNEPTFAPGQAATWWDESLPECMASIRKNDASVWIVVEPYMAFANSFVGLPLVADERVIYSFHHYWPHGYTHQGVRFRQGRYAEDSRGKWTYPGYAPRVEGPNLAHQNLSYWNKAAVRQAMQPVVDFQKLHPGVRILAGEFGVIRWAPNGAEWLKDVIDIFEEQKWDWTFHALGEWNGWDPTYAAEDEVKRDRHPFVPGVKETDRLKVVTAGWALNQRN